MMLFKHFQIAENKTMFFKYFPQNLNFFGVLLDS